MPACSTSATNGEDSTMTIVHASWKVAPFRQERSFTGRLEPAAAGASNYRLWCTAADRWVNYQVTTPDSDASTPAWT
jgi:hypothetical protein